MAVMDTLVRWVTGRQTERAFPALAFQDWVNYFNFNGATYPLRQTLLGDTEQIGADFTGLVQGAYKGNGIVFACMLARMMLFSEARFQFQQMRGGRPGDLFGTNDLEPLEHPEPGKVTGDLLTRAIVDVDLAGNHFLTRRIIDGQVRLKRLRPDWVSMVLGSMDAPQLDTRDIDAEVLGYVYHPGGRHSGIEPEFLLANTVAHFAPIPDPVHRFRGMSWLTPIIRDVQGDSAATSHKDLFFSNGATPNMVVTIDTTDLDKFSQIVDKIEEGHTGLANAFKTLYLSAGTKAEVVGSHFQEIDLKGTQGAGEVRIAAAAGVHPVIVGLSEGLQGSSLNQGNFMAARRLMADRTLRPLWRNFASSLEVIVPPPSGARLWYDDRHIPFLAEDVTDAANVQSLQAQTIKALSDAGADWDAVIDAVTSGDLTRLKGKHSGLFSVQLQPPTTELEPAAPATNGTQPAELEAGRAFLLEMARSHPDPQPVTIEEGAIQYHAAPITVEAPQITFPEGFVRSETTVEPTQVTIEKGAVQVDAPVTVEPAEVRIEAPITVEPAQVTLEQPKKRTVQKVVSHDAKGRISRVIETEE